MWESPTVFQINILFYNTNDDVIHDLTLINWTCYVEFDNLW
jgi:hypothetical protein